MTSQSVPSPRDEGGFALVAVLLVMALMGVLGAEFAYSMRLEASSVRAYKDNVIASHLAEAAFEQAVREIVADAPYVAVADDGLLTFYTRERIALRRLQRKDVPLAGGDFSYRISDESARINITINASLPARIDRLLQELGVKKIERDTILDSIQDWIDGNEDHRLNGAESDDTYLKLSVPYRSRNGRLESINELLQIKGITPALFKGDESTPGLADLVTVRTGSAPVNINTAGKTVLTAMGLSSAEILEIEQARRDAPYITVPPRFGGRSLAAITRTFRIEATGRVNGRVRARLTAIVQRRGDAANPVVQVLEWSGIQ
jgi:general secretion pathway protein K